MIQRFLQLFKSYSSQKPSKRDFKIQMLQIFYEAQTGWRDHIIHKSIFFKEKKLETCIQISWHQIGCSLNDASLFDYSQALLWPHELFHACTARVQVQRPFLLCLQNMEKHPTCPSLLFFHNSSAYPFKNQLSLPRDQQALGSSAFTTDTWMPFKALTVSDSLAVWCFVRYMDRIWLRNILEMLNMSVWWHSSDSHCW